MKPSRLWKPTCEGAVSGAAVVLAAALLTLASNGVFTVMEWLKTQFHTWANMIVLTCWVGVILGLFKFSKQGGSNA